MIQPQYLKSGDKIGIVSPAGHISSEIVEKAAIVIESKGYEVVRGEHLKCKHHQFAGSDRDRQEDLQEMLDNQDIKVIICSRGGYGMIRLIKNLDFIAFRENPKWVVGFSDITVLHAHLNHNLNIASIHGPMLKMLAEQPESISTKMLFDILKGDSPEIKLNSKSMSGSALIEGKLTGGNLSIICSLIGTDYDFDPVGKILFIEDIGEHHYKIDRMLHQLLLSNKLTGLKAIILGQFSELKDDAEYFGEVIADMLRNKLDGEGPVIISGFPSGHEDTNLSLILNSRYQISFEEEQLVFKSLRGD